MRALVALRGLAGGLFLVSLILGLFIWMGNASSLVGIHMILGVLFVVTLLIQAVVAARAGAPLGMTIALGLLAIAIAWLGMNQAALMPGPNHWVVRLTHLLLAIGVMPLSGRLPTLVRTGAPLPQEAA